MKTWLVKFWYAFWNDPAFFAARVRTLIMTGGLIGAFEAKQIADSLVLPPSGEVWIRRIGIICAGFSVLIKAGDKNEAKDTAVVPSPPAA